MQRKLEHLARCAMTLLQAGLLALSLALILLPAERGDVSLELFHLLFALECGWLAWCMVHRLYSECERHGPPARSLAYRFRSRGDGVLERWAIGVSALASVMLVMS